MWNLDESKKIWNLSKIEIEFGRLTMTCHEIAMPPIGFFRYRFSSLLTYDHVLMMSLQSPSNVRADRAPFAYWDICVHAHRGKDCLFIMLRLKEEFLPEERFAQSRVKVDIHSPRHANLSFRHSTLLRQFKAPCNVFPSWGCFPLLQVDQCWHLYMTQLFVNVGNRSLECGTMTIGT